MKSAQSWTANWATVRGILSGSQADSKVVKRKSNDDATLYFLKILRRQSDQERRKRMHREVSAYTTLSHSGLPRLIESNSHYFADDAYKLYLVTEYVDGQNLSSFVEERGPLQLQDALRLTMSLLEIVMYCHREECVHRDIKPDNIMLRSGDIQSPLLVDFGLTFNGAESADFGTELGQEIGNRFLRLPELGIDSSNKRDPRSDLTYVCGILLFLLTGYQPVLLLDEQSRLPHQRSQIASKLSSLPFDPPMLLQIFDRGFQNNIELRWHRGEQLYSALETLQTHKSINGMTKSSEEILNELASRAASTSMQTAILHRNTLESGLKSAQQEFTQILHPFTNILTNLQSGYAIDVGTLTARNTLGAVRLDGKGEMRFRFEVVIVGSELIVKCSSEDRTIELLRTNALNPEYDDIYRESLRLFVATGLDQLLSK